MATALATLNSLERSRLRVCEATLERTKASFIEAGNALAEIRDGRLYRETHKTFEVYVKDTWNFNKQRACQLIQSAKVAGNVQLLDVSPPTSDAQARPLAELPADQQATALETARERAAAAGKPVTAAVVQEVVDEMRQPDYSCPNCGGHERDEDGDCATCREPAAPTPSRTERPREQAASPVDTAKAQIKIWYDTIGRWLGKSPSIDELRAEFPGARGDTVVRLATELYEALKLWERGIR